MDPDLMKAAQAAMKDMPPEKLAALQSQATNYTPEMMQQAMRAVSHGMLCASCWPCSLRFKRSELCPRRWKA